MANIPKKIKVKGAFAEFLVADWTALGGQYVVDIQHNLESQDVQVKLWENSVDEVFVDRMQIVNTNTVRLYTAIDPDCRFDGKAVITRI